MGDGTFIGDGVTIYYTNTDPKSGEGIFITGGDIRLLAQNLDPVTVTPSDGKGGPGAIEDMLIYLGKQSNARVDLKVMADLSSGEQYMRPRVISLLVVPLISKIKTLRLL